MKLLTETQKFLFHNVKRKADCFNGLLSMTSM
jgi:hypothetical protein